MKLLDYSFYRTYLFYKNSGDSSPILMGCLVVSLMSGFAILDITILSRVFIKYDLNHSLKVYLLILLVGSMITFNMRYGGMDKVQSLIIRFGGEDERKSQLRGWLIVAYLIASISIPIIFGYLHGNLGWDI